MSTANPSQRLCNDEMKELSRTARDRLRASKRLVAVDRIAESRTGFGHPFESFHWVRAIAVCIEKKRTMSNSEPPR